jgi:hypothetical protein
VILFTAERIKPFVIKEHFLIISLVAGFYPQSLDKFFKKTEISISFVRPPYPDNPGISAGQIRESLLKVFTE